MKEESKNSEFTTKDREMSASLDTDKLRRMGFHYPELALKVIDVINHSTNLKGIKGLKVENLKTGERSCVNSYDVEETEVYRWEILRVYLSAPEFPFSFAETGKDAREYDVDCLHFINREFTPTADEDVQFDIVWDADIEDMSLEDSLKIHLKKEEEESKAEKKVQNNADLSLGRLKKMGFNFPFTASLVIEKIEQGGSPETINSGFVNSRIKYTVNGHRILFLDISGDSIVYSDIDKAIRELDSESDPILFVDGKWVQTTKRRLLLKVLDSLHEGKSVEEALECLKEDEAEETKKAEDDTPALASHDSEGEQIRIITEESSDVIEANKAAACDDTAKAKDSDKEEATEKRPNDWWTQQINAIEFTREEFEKAKAKQSEKSEAPCDLQCAVSFCKDIFEEKCALYGLSFIEMHIETLTDQLFMKAAILKNRLTERNKGKRFESYFFEGVRDEFAAVVNYGVIALRQGGFGVQSLVPDEPIKFYTDQMKAVLSLICDKGDDYGELWRDLRIGTFADMIYTKVLRVKRIENQYRVGGMTEEGYHKFVEDQYRDMINYGLFGVVRTDDICNVLALTVYEDEEEFE